MSDNMQAKSQRRIPTAAISWKLETTTRGNIRNQAGPSDTVEKHRPSCLIMCNQQAQTKPYETMRYDITWAKMSDNEEQRASMRKWRDTRVDGWRVEGQN